MPSPRLRRSLAAVLTALACLTLMVTPAAAVTHDADITGGEITFTRSGFTPFAFHPASASCTAPTLELDVTGTSVDVTDFGMATHGFLIDPGLGSFLAVFTRSPLGSSTGTLSGTNLTSLRFGIVVTFYSTASCTPTGTPLCTIAFLLHLGGTLTGTTTSSTFSLTGSSTGTTAAFPTCVAGATYYTIGLSASVTSAITGHLTT